MKTKITVGDLLEASRQLAKEYPMRVGPSSNRGCFGAQVLKMITGRKGTITCYSTPTEAYDAMVKGRMLIPSGPHADLIPGILSRMMSMNDHKRQWSDINSAMQKSYGHLAPRKPEPPKVKEAKPKGTVIPGTKWYLPATWVLAEKDEIDLGIEKILDEANAKSEDKTLVGV